MNQPTEQHFAPSPWAAPGMKSEPSDSQRVLPDEEIIKRIAAEVSVYYKKKKGYSVLAEDILSKSREEGYTTARHICMVAFHKHRRYTLKATGKACGGRDHTSVINAINKVFTWAKTDAEMFELVERAFASISLSLAARLPELIQHHFNKQSKTNKKWA